MTLQTEGFLFVFIVMKNIYKILLILLIILLILLIVKIKPSNEPFNRVTLTNDNSIENLVYPSYYDTILNVAMSQMNLSGNIVIIQPLSDNAKSQFDGELKAHIRYFNGKFYLFTINLDRKDAIEVLSHEVIHMDQYTSGNLIYNNNGVTWMGETMDLNSKEYEQRPWENDAFKRQGDLINSIEKILYERTNH